MRTDIMSGHGTEVPDTLLIVDDTELNRAILEQIFSDGYAVEEAENGQECILRHTAAVGAVVQRPLCGLSSGRN